VPDPDEEVRAEIEFHLEERAREFEDEGLEPDDARREAGRVFGDVERIAGEVRRIRRRRKRDEGMRTMTGSVMQDVRVSLRALARRPGFAVVVIGTLALGIGAVTAIFSVVNGSLLRALPFEDGEGLVFLQGAYDAPDGPAIRGASPPEARDWEAMSRSFSEVSVADATSYTLTGDGQAEVVPAERVDEGYFDLLRVEPALGRTFTEEEYRAPGTYFVTVLGHGLWQRRFGGDPSVIGRTVMLGGQPWTVVGVMPEGFGGTRLDADLFVPLATLGEETLSARGSRFLGVVARLAPGVDLESAQADMDGVAARLEAEHPRSHEDRIALVTPARDVYLGSTRTLMLVILGAASLLLLIATANVTNLLLVRATTREGEVVMRRALGAGRGRLVRQFLTESLVLSVLGAGAGLILGVWGARALADAMPEALLPAFVEVRPDATVFLVVTGIMTLVGVAAGLAPGLAAAREDLASSLRASRDGGTGRSRLQGTIVVTEVALALLLLVGAGLMTRSFRAQLGVDPGYDHEELYGFSLFLPGERFASEEVRPTVDELLRRLEDRPEVAEATVMSDMPLRGGYSATYMWLAGATGDEDRIRFYIHRVGPDWFETMGTAVERGRPIRASDAEDELPVAVISQALADRFFEGEDPLGQRVFLGTRDDGGHVIVGVADDVRYRDLTTDIRGGADDPDVYVPWERYPNRSVDIVLRPRSGGPGALESVAREVVGEFDPLLALTATGPLSEDLRAQTAQARFGFQLLTAFSALAATLAVIGLYGVLAFHVGRRRREIAVRMALGAERGRVRGMVVAQGMRLAGLGLVIGLAGAWVGARSVAASPDLQDFLFRVDAVDPATWAAVVLLLAAVAALAALIPAVRATRVEPQGALRDQ
jgi:predicted permease